MPGELYPEAAVFQVLQENEQRFPEAVHTGWRARMRAQQLEVKIYDGHPDCNEIT